MQRAAFSLSVLLALAACGQDAPRGDPLTGAGAPADAVKPPHGMPPRAAEPAAQPPELPAGHPPMDGPVKQAPPLGAKPAASSFTWTVPQGWTESPVKPGGMRLAQMDVPGESPTGFPSRLAVFAGPMGDKRSNIDRWVGQLTQPDGTPTRDRAKIDETKRDGLVVTRIEMRGTFGGMQGEGGKDWTFLGAIVEAEGDPQTSVIVRLADASKVVDPQIPQFDALLASIKLK